MSRMVFSERFEAGQEIFRSGDPARNAYIIERGQVEVSFESDGEKIIIAILGKGELFGEMSMIDDAPRSATVTALEDTEVVVMQRSRFQRPIMAADPLMNMLMRVMVNRFREAQRKMSGLRDGPPDFDPTLEQARQIALRRIEDEKDMRHGLDIDQFVLNYQPIISLKSGHIAGFEALMRWKKSDGSFISPVEFIPLAEETGLIVELGRWSLKLAIEDHVDFSKRFAAVFGDQHKLFMSINVSGLQLSEMAEIDELSTIINEAAVDPSMIKLEMTETLLVEDPAHAAKALRKIKESGVSIAIDDFGTGYSSLSYLHQFPLDTLKIDREFVINMDKAENSRRIVSSIAQLALSLDMNIVAEGIEEKAQMDALRELGCHYGQGYYMARPMPAEDIIALIDSKPTW
ncbi:MAG: EAL domain-containing protein [Rhodospirillales bacterium]|nr:EAL domain-containing protein [Rhodospirillales bacterium]